MKEVWKKGENMNFKWKELPWQKIALIGIMMVSIGCVIGYILYCTDYYFDSDYASYILLAKEQVRTGQFFPEGFCYSTGVFVLTPELFILPFLPFVSDLILCRELAVICWNVLLVLSVFLLFKLKGMSQQKIKFAPFVIMILLCVPMGHYKENYYEAAYAVLIIYEMLMFFCLYKFMEKGEKVKKRYYVLFFLTVFFANIEGVRNIAVMVVPLAGAIVLELYFEHQKNLIEAFKEKRQLFLIVFNFVAAICGIIAFFLLARKVDLLSGTASMVFVTKEEVWINFQNLFQSILNFYGAIGKGDLISYGGITAAINFVVLVVCMFVLPLYYLIRIKKIESRFWRIYVLYAWISNFIVLYMMVFTNATVERYLHTVFFHNAVLFALFLEEVFRKREKILHAFWILAILAVAGAGHLNYYKNTIKPIENAYAEREKTGELHEFLLEHGLTYGFSNFWNAYENTVRSHYEVMILAWQTYPQDPYFWLTQREWYNVEEHPGKCFLVVDVNDQIPEQYYQAAEEQLQFQNYKILVYEKNIFMYEELNTIYQ